jgi:hypothetical protein
MTLPVDRRVSDDDVAALRKAFDERDTAKQLWMSVVGQQCKAAGYGLHLDNGRTGRRLAIGRALLALADLGDDDLAASLLGAQPTTIGAALVSLTTREAEALAELAGFVRRARSIQEKAQNVLRVCTKGEFFDAVYDLMSEAHELVEALGAVKR